MTLNSTVILSIVVPIYNVALYLDQCLDSLLVQGLKENEFEVLMVNDGSTDGSELIAEKWQRNHSNFKLINQTNGGLSVARNTGLDNSTGEFLVFLDSDDIVPQGTYRSMLDILQKSGSDFITSPAFRFAAWKRKAWPFERNYDLYSEPRVGVTFSDHPEFIRDFTSWNKIYRRKFFVNSGVRFPEGRIYEDIATSPLLYQKAQAFDVYSAPGYFWRITPGSITQTLKPVKALDRLWSLNTMLDFFDTVKLNPHQRKEIEFAVVDYNLRWVFNDYHAFAPSAQKQILHELTTVVERLSTEVDSFVDDPFPQYLPLIRNGEFSQLHSIIAQSPQQQQEISEPIRKKFQRRAKKSFRLIKSSTSLQKLTFKRRIKHVVLYLVLRPLIFMIPVDDMRVVASSYWGTKFSLSDGPPTMARAIAEHNKKIKLKIFVNPRNAVAVKQSAQEIMPRDANIEFVKNDSVKYYYNLWRAKYLFNDVNFHVGFWHDKFTKTRKQQIEIQTTHGIPLKKLGLDTETAIHQNDRRKFIAKSKRYDYIVSSSPLIASTFSKSHGVHPKVLKTGLPQNDSLFLERTPSEIRDLKKKLGLNPEKRIVVYAPTFRFGRGYAFRFLLDFVLLHEALAADTQFVIKTHHFNHTHLQLIDFAHLTQYAESNNKDPFVKLFGEVRSDVNYVPVTTSQDELEKSISSRHFHDAEINSLMTVADVLITDYSSIVFSFSHLNKPLIVFTPDIEDYSAKRGYYFNIDEIAPGAVAKTTKDILKALELASDSNAWREAYGSNIRNFKDSFLAWETGDAAKKIINELGIPRQH